MRSGSVITRTARAALLGSVAIGLAAPAGAATTEELEQQLEMLLREVRELKRQQEDQQQRIERQDQVIDSQREELEKKAEKGAVTPAPANVVTGGDIPGSFKLPGTDTSVKIGGYVKGDLIYDVDADTGDSFAASTIPADGSPGNKRDGSFRAHARQTRVNLTTVTPTDYGSLKTYVEGDFFGTGGNEGFSNSTSFRLRHAFGQFGPVLAGQTWTLFMPLASYPETVDFFGPAGIPFIRQGQLRYTQEVGNGFTVAGSLENSELSARDSTGRLIGSENNVRFGIDTLPDFVGALEYSGERFSAKLSGVGRLLDLEGTTGFSESEFGWGVHASTVVSTFGDDSLQLNFTYGDGIGRYLINGFANDAFIDAGTGSLETIEAWGFAGGYTHYWSGQFRSNLVYGRFQNEDTFAAGDTESLDTVHANLIWSPVPQADIGIEAIWGYRSFQDSDLDNDALRFQFGAKYSF